MCPPNPSRHALALQLVNVVRCRSRKISAPAYRVGVFRELRGEFKVVVSVFRTNKIFEALTATNLHIEVAERVRPADTA